MLSPYSPKLYFMDSTQQFGGEHPLMTEPERVDAIETIGIGKVATGQGSRFSAMARDVATMGGGTALAAVFNTLLVFLIPRLVSVEDFGYWRLFLLYVSYTGFLHLGFAEGLLLRWAGRPVEMFRHEVGASLKFLLCQHLALIVPACFLIALILPSPLHLIGIATLVFALIVNLGLVLQYSLQSARRFKPIAFATGASAGIFVVLTFLWHLRAVPSFQALIILYCASWTGALIYLWVQVKPLHRAYGSNLTWTVGKTCITTGWPIVLASCGLGLVQSADRLIVSSTLPIRDFAQYSLASSMMFVPVTAIAAVYRVFFSHVAAVEHEGRARVYGHASKFLLLAWSLLLPYFFVLEVFVRWFLPKYLTALPVAGILLLGVIFLAGIQILHMSFTSLYGMQREFLFLTVGALVVSFSVALVLAILLRSLVAVAIGQVVALAVWWIANEWLLRETSGQSWKDWMQVLLIVGWSATGYGFAFWFTIGAGWRIPTYYGLVVPMLWFSGSEELRLGWRMIRTNAGNL
jgi:O-antigen/teichoic acid export membrane protein